MLSIILEKSACLTRADAKGLEKLFAEVDVYTPPELWTWIDQPPDRPVDKLRVFGANQYEQERARIFNGAPKKPELLFASYASENEKEEYEKAGRAVSSVIAERILFAYLRNPEETSASLMNAFINAFARDSWILARSIRRNASLLIERARASDLRWGITIKYTHGPVERTINDIVATGAARSEVRLPFNKSVSILGYAVGRTEDGQAPRFSERLLQDVMLFIHAELNAPHENESAQVKFARSYLITTLPSDRKDHLLEALRAAAAPHPKSRLRMQRIFSDYGLYPSVGASEKIFQAHYRGFDFCTAYVD